MATGDPLKIMIVANKTWEASPLIQALFSDRSRPTGLASVARVYDPDVTPCITTGTPTPRATLAIPGHATIEVWCIEDWMDPGAGSSNTPEKVRVLPRFFSSSAGGPGGSPDVVLAFGTAGIPTGLPFNGCVAVGTRCFIHDPFAGKPPPARVIVRRDKRTEPMWTDSRLDTLLTSTAPADFFRRAQDAARYAAEARFVAPPIHAGAPLTVLAGNGFASLGTVNVTNYDDYVWADPAVLKAFNQGQIQNEVGSQETTHGLVRLAAEDFFGATPQFFYVSGITDSLGLFDMEVGPRQYAQNFAAAHNAGVALAWLLPELTTQCPKTAATTR
jgi:hypothetical protein